MYRVFFKRFFDFVFAFMIFGLLLPIFIVVVLLIFIANRTNPFFFQLRPGKNGKIFRIIKLKTMSDKRDQNGCLLPDEMRLTQIGKVIRKLSIDELPQLINVLKGDMSIIGPRPLLVEYLPLYNENQKKRHSVRPGITGWAQVNGRNLLTWQEKFELDIWYVNNLTFKLDFLIVIKTIIKVIKSDGVNQSQNITMEKFNGN